MQVDIIFGKSHLFKRSIILIKAWCYYEARLLGGQNGLFSTYALDIMIMYVLNKHYKDIRSPLVAFKFFLQYYSVFEWDKYCLTLRGKQQLSMHPYWDGKEKGITFNESIKVSHIGVRGVAISQ